MRFTINYKNMSNLEIKQVPIKDLKFATYNPKNFNNKQFKRLKMSIEQHGWLEPIIVNKRTNNVVDGNQRLKCALKGGSLEAEVPVVYIDVDLDTDFNLKKVYNPDTPKQKKLGLGRIIDGEAILSLIRFASKHGANNIDEVNKS